MSILALLTSPHRGRWGLGGSNRTTKRSSAVHIGAQGKAWTAGGGGGESQPSWGVTDAVQRFRA